MTKGQYRSGWKKSIGIGLFLLLVIIGDRLGGFIGKKLTRQSQFRFSRMYTGRAASEMLLIGNSRGLCFYQPYLEQETGLSTLNLSYNAMPINLMKTLVDDYLAHYDPPEIALIDITICDRKNPQLIHQFTPYFPFSDRLQKLIFQSSSHVGHAAQWIHLFRYNSELFHRSLFYLDHSDENWLLDRTITPELIQKIDDQYDFYIHYPPEMVRYLKELTATLENAGTVVCLLVNPYYPPFRDRMHDLDRLIALVEETTGKQVVDFSRSITDEKAFGDFQHLNRTGAKVYVDLLLEKGILDFSSIEK